jgi:hypothetical protein
MKKPALRKNLTMPPDWWEAFERAARAAGETLSEWIGNAARKALPAEQRKRLSERTPPGRPGGEKAE